MNLKQEFKWESILSKVEKNISKEQFQTWFNNLIASPCTERNLRIIAPNKFVKECLSNNYKDLLVSIVKDIFNARPKIEFVCKEEEGEKSKKNIRHNNRREKKLSIINKNYTFDNFVIGNCNRLAHAAAMSIIESPGYVYNPLFIYGPTGTGKTHLLQSIYIKLSSNNLDSSILYLTCEDLINNFVSTIEDRSPEEFREKIRRCDILLIDDIHLLATSEAAKEEFFHTFNALYNSQRQIVLSSSCSPDEMLTLDKKIISRFNWGLKCKLETPDIETSIAIIERKADLLGINLPLDARQFIAENITSNIREIEGAILKIRENAIINNNQINLDITKSALYDYIKDKKNVNIEKILKITAQHLSTNTMKLLSKNRSKSIALPRQIAMYLARKLTNLSFNEIGGYMGGRDHSTVIYSYKKIRHSQSKDKDLMLLLKKIENDIQSG